MLSSTDPNLLRLPPESVRITSLRAEPWPDGRRIRVVLELTPFEKQPNVELYIDDSSGACVADTLILETMFNKLAVTLHLRRIDQGGAYTLRAVIRYAEIDQPVDQSEVVFTVKPEPGEAPPGG